MVSSSSVPLCFSLTLSQSADLIFEVQKAPHGWAFKDVAPGTSVLVNDEEAAGYTMVYGAPKPADPKERVSVAVYFNQQYCDARLINKATISDADLADWLSRVISADLATRLDVDADLARAAIRFADAVEDLFDHDDGITLSMSPDEFVERVVMLLGDYIWTDDGELRAERKLADYLGEEVVDEIGPKSN